MDLDDLDFESPSRRKRRERKQRNRIRRLLRGTTKTSERPTKWWVIKPSEVEVDERFEDKPLGLGVFTTRRVKETIYFEGGEYICLTRLKLTSRRRDYAVCSDDKNYVVTPTDLDIERGSLNYCWRINHSTSNPTHELEWDNTESQSHPYGRPVLIPLRFVEVDEELTFDYCNK